MTERTSHIACPSTAPGDAKLKSRTLKVTTRHLSSQTIKNEPSHSLGDTEGQGSQENEKYRSFQKASQSYVLRKQYIQNSTCSVPWAGLKAHGFAISKSNDRKSSYMCKTSGIKTDWRLPDIGKCLHISCQVTDGYTTPTHHHLGDNTLLTWIFPVIRIIAPRGRFIITASLPLRKTTA